jgi:hypothetical protein
MSTVLQRNPTTAGGKAEGSNFQHIFKMQMIKRERKASTLQAEREAASQSYTAKQKPKSIINLLINDSHHQPKPRQSLDSLNAPTPPSLTHTRADKSLSSSKHLMEGVLPNKPARTISHGEIKACDGVWRIKQLSKAFEREKLSLLQRYRCKMRRKEVSGEHSNLLATSISPLANNPKKHSAPPTQPRPKEGRQKASYRYRDIPISEFIYEKGLTRSDNAINQGMERRMEELCRKRNTRPVDSI